MDKVYTYISNNKWVEWLLFLTIFWLAIVHLQLNRGLSDMIPGYHYWRKTDTYTQIMNYYNNGLNFFDHSIYFNQMKSNGKAVAEFPLFYYFIAIQQKIFGQYDIILKINWLIVLFFGQFSLYKIGFHFTKNIALSFLIPFSLFLSPIFTIYCIEYLPDPIALNFSFIGLYFLLKYRMHKQKASIFWSVFFISLAGLMKPFYLIPFIAFVMVDFLYGAIKKQLNYKQFYYGIPFLLVGIWYFYVNWYNSVVNSSYFLASTKSYWSTKPEDIRLISLNINEKWWPDYLHTNYWIPLIILAIIIFIYLMIKERYKAFYIVLAFLGSIAFIILFYGMLKSHDYYIFPILFLLPLIFLGCIYMINNLIKVSYVKYGIGVLGILLLFQSMTYSWEIKQNRLKSKRINSTYLYKPYVEMEAFLEENNVKKNDLIITYSDKSPSYALILLNRKGWSGFQTFYRKRYINDLIEKGAKYIVINQSLPLKRDSIALNGVNMTYLADSNNIYLYKLNK